MTGEYIKGLIFYENSERKEVNDEMKSIHVNSKSAEVLGDDSYETNEYIAVIKDLVSTAADGRWSGTASEIKYAVASSVGRELSEKPCKIGKLIAKHEKKLRADGVKHTIFKSNNRVHIFSKIE